MRSYAGRLAFLKTCTFVILLMVSCNKNDHQVKNHELKTLKQQEVPDWVLKKWAAEGSEVTYIVNQKVQVELIDRAGNSIKIGKGKIKDSQNNNVSVQGTMICDPDLFIGDFDENEWRFERETITFYPTEGYTVKVFYTVSSGFHILQNDPANSSQKSSGATRIKDAAGNIIYSNTSIVPLTIVETGVDPTSPKKTLFKVSYTITGIPEDKIRSIKTLEHRLTAYTECQEIGVRSAWHSGNIKSPIFNPMISHTTDDINSCNRIDKIYMAPAGSNWIYLGGCNYMAAINGGTNVYPGVLTLTMPHEHEIEWRQAGSASYQNWPTAEGQELPFSIGDKIAAHTQRIYFNTINTCNMVNGRLTSIGHAIYKLPYDVTGAVEIRYRNIRKQVAANPCADDICRSADWVYTSIIVPAEN